MKTKIKEIKVWSPILHKHEVRVRNLTAREISIFPSTVNQRFEIKIPSESTIRIVNLTRRFQVIPILKQRVTLQPGKSYIFIDVEIDEYNDRSFITLSPDGSEADKKFGKTNNNIFWIVPKDVKELYLPFRIQQRILVGSDPG